MKITIDIDDVLCQTAPARLHYLFHRHNWIPPKEGMTEYFFRDIFNIDQEAALSLEHEFITEHGATLLPLSGAFENLTILKARGYEFHGLTARSPQFANMTFDWVECHLPGLLNEIRHSHTPEGAWMEKYLCCREMKADIHIDDHHYHIEKCLENDIPAILFGQYEWNAHSLHRRANDWNHILELLQ